MKLNRIDHPITTTIFLILLIIGILAITAVYFYQVPIHKVEPAMNLNEEDILSNDTDLTYLFVDMPKNRLTFDNFELYSNEFIITNVPYADTIQVFEATASGSMLPLLYNGSKTIIIRPLEEDIMVGDIVVYKDNDGTNIIHRLVNKGYDEKGTYYMTKGDNNPSLDPYLIRYENIEGVVIGILY